MIDRFYDRELRARRVHVVPIHGTTQLTVTTVEFLARLGKAVRILFDNVRAEALRPGKPPEGVEPSFEEAKLRTVLRELRALTNEPGVDVAPLPFEEPDILCALPEDAVRAWLARRYGKSDFSWAEVKRRHRESGEARSIKKTFVEGLPGADPNRVVMDILPWCQPGSRPMPSLERAMSAASTSATPLGRPHRSA